jgi:ubiquinone/menaquinone biosynthesis C-methylase UbiE
VFPKTGEESLKSILGRYQRIASLYDLLDGPFESGRYRRLRPKRLAGLSGRILDAGVGTGRNFPFYPSGAEVVGIDLSPAMLARAVRRRHRSAANVELHEMDVMQLRFPDGSFDAAVASFLFASCPTDCKPARCGSCVVWSGRTASFGCWSTCVREGQCAG